MNNNTVIEHRIEDDILNLEVLDKNLEHLLLKIRRRTSFDGENYDYKEAFFQATESFKILKEIRDYIDNKISSKKRDVYVMHLTNLKIKLEKILLEEAKKQAEIKEVRKFLGIIKDDPALRSFSDKDKELYSDIRKIHYEKNKSNKLEMIKETSKKFFNDDLLNGFLSKVNNIKASLLIIQDSILEQYKFFKLSKRSIISSKDDNLKVLYKRFIKIIMSENEKISDLLGFFQGSLENILADIILTKQKVKKDVEDISNIETVRF